MKNNLPVMNDILSIVRQIEDLDFDTLKTIDYKRFEDLLKIVLNTDDGTAKMILKNKKMKNIQLELRNLWAKYEYQREKRWVEKILDSENAWSEIKKYPAFPFYQKLIKFEFAISNALVVEEIKNILFIGSGPLPLSTILLSKQTNVHVDGIDIIAEACELGTRLAKKLKLENVFFFTETNISKLEIDKYDLIVLATLAGETDTQKREIIESLHSRMNPKQILIIRTVWGLRPILYPKVKLSDLNGFRLHFNNSFSNIINSVIVAQKLDKVINFNS